MQQYLAVLRSINVGGRHKLPMASLRQLAETLGWQGVKSYIQSGNLVFRSAASSTELEAHLEIAIKQQFDYSVPVIVRSLDAWRTYISHNPFLEAALTEPNKVMLGLSKEPPEPSAVEMLHARATQGETVVIGNGCLYAHFPQGVGRSKLTTALLDRAVGSTVTMRNWRTAGTLLDLAEKL